MERNDFCYRLGKLPSVGLIINASPPSIKLGTRCLNDMIRFLYCVIFLNSQCSPKVTKLRRHCAGESIYVRPPLRVASRHDKAQRRILLTFETICPTSDDEIFVNI
uniref:Uncharacterized protein n=1 Tax=Bactrocera latifrons TaxID=174628 RepID=A0A0K8U8I7_BACLA